MKQIITNSTGVYEITGLACPACGLPLYRKMATSPTFIYCPHGKCESKAANNGASGPDIETAFALLEVAFGTE